MRKVFIDCGCREGWAISALFGDSDPKLVPYVQCLKQRPDAHEYEIFGFESQDCIHLPMTRASFSNVNLKIIEKLVWTNDGVIDFLSDGDSFVNRLVNVDDGLHPNLTAKVVSLPCIDLARWILEEFTPEDYLVLKLDIEGAEYDVLRRLVVSGAIKMVRELYVEYHTCGNVSYRQEFERLFPTGMHYRPDWP